MRANKSRPVKRRLGIAAAALALVAAGVPAAQAAEPEAVRAAECDAVRTDWTAQARPQADPEPLLNAYSNTGKGWTGGDSTYSVQLSGGRTVWIFSDTFLGPVNPDGSRPTTTPFLNNSFVVQRGDSVETVTGGTPANPTALVEPPANGWYWFGAAQTSNAGRNLDVVALRFEKTGPGQWDWRWASNHLARFDSKTLKLRKLTPIPSAANVQWSAWLQREGAYTYIYGVEDLGLDKYLHIARTSGSLRGQWQYYTGGDPDEHSSWSRDEADSVRVMNHVSNEHSVHKLRDGLYMLTTMDTSVPFSAEIVAYFSCSPTGPFTNRTSLYTAPETGLFGTYGDPDIYSYNAHAHPQFSRGSELLVTYNVNSMRFDDLYADADLYRARFVRVVLPDVVG